MDIKLCSKCKIEKPVSDFYKKKSTKDGLQYHCKQCKTSYNQSHYKANTEKYKVKRKRHQAVYFDRNRRLVREYLLQHPCIDCGEFDPIVLEFDHRDQADKLFCIGSSLGGISEDSLIAEIAKCDIRCANCHRRRTAVQLGWYAWLDNYSVVE